jgi:hypothetical protein
MLAVPESPSRLSTVAVPHRPKAHGFAVRLLPGKNEGLTAKYREYKVDDSIDRMGDILS